MLLMLLRISFMSRVRLSLMAICLTWSRFWYRAMEAFRGRETNMTATPQKADQPRRL